MAERQGRQLLIVAGKLRNEHLVSAHDMLMRHGITRTASIIHTLRHVYGWGIHTQPRQPGDMATYLLETEPLTWELALRPRKSTREVWSCSACGQTANIADLTKSTPTIALGHCGSCSARRVFRPER
jgi:hypothetical protein